MNLKVNQEYELHESMTNWSNSIIESAKALMSNDNGYRFSTRSLPWYRTGDCWIENSWWINAAKETYQKYYDTDVWIAEELEILVKYDPNHYTDYARSRINLWYSNNYTHDCESWIDLAMLVYPEHEIFQEFYQNISGNSYSEKIILANLGYEEIFSQIRDELLGYLDEQDSFWLNDRLSGLATCGGEMLVKSVISEDELQFFRNWIRSIAEEDTFLLKDGSSKENDHSIGQSASIRTAVLLDWQDVIDVLAQNNHYLGSLDAFDILWWSLTDKKQLIQDLILQYKSRPSSLSHIGSEAMALAIAWKRSVI